MLSEVGEQMTKPNISADSFLRRKDAANALTELGLRIAEATLATMATRGGGPPYRTFGRTVVYQWGDTLKWAESRLSAPRCSTSEADGAT